MRQWSVTIEHMGHRTTRRFWTERKARGCWLFWMAEGGIGSWPAQLGVRHASVTMPGRTVLDAPRAPGILEER